MLIPEKTFSVVAELEDGTTKDITVRGQTSSDAFRLVRAMPGVRRVGRVSEPTARESGGEHSRNGRHARALEQRAPRSSFTGIGHSLSGPRVVVHAPRAGGEQPFKHLQAPPERPKTAPSLDTRVVKPPQHARLAPATAAVAPIAAALEYRIAKSRRRDGKPYLLQRGRWQSANGKRAFGVEWEKGFDEREQAERHREWLVQVESEPVELEQSA